MVSQKLKVEREKIVTEEAKKARLILETDIDRKAKEVADLQEVLKDRDIKLAEAQKTQLDLLRKQRELDDARRELDLTVEKKVQESLTVVRDKAKQEAEGGLKLKVLEKEEQIASMQRQIEELKRRSATRYPIIHMFEIFSHRWFGLRHRICLTGRMGVNKCLFLLAVTRLTKAWTLTVAA